MYDVTAPAVYITERVDRDPRSVARLERMMTHVRARTVRRVTDAELNTIVAEDGLLPGGRTGQTVRDDERVIVFNAFGWYSDDEMQERATRYPNLCSDLLLAHHPWTFRDRDRLRSTHHGVCQSAYELHCAHGCFHGCRYCHIRSVVNIMLNLE